MFKHDDDVMDFGEDDDGATQEFLTGKLAALGIDEDLELSGEEEENEDPADGSKGVESAAPPKLSCSPHRPGEASIEAEGPMTTERNQGSAANSEEHCPSPSAAVLRATNTAAVEKGTAEEGELLEMLNKPLQTSRGRLQGTRCGAILDSGGSRRRGRPRGGKGKPYHLKEKEQGRKWTIKECATWVCKRLNEPKYYLMCQVVTEIGYNNSKRLLGRVQQIQEAGGMPTADGTRKRTPGGVFFTLLKEHMEPAKLKELYADELRVKREKDRMRKVATKRRAAAADTGEDVSMPPRDPPRNRGGAAWRNMGAWVSPSDGDVTVKRARNNQAPGGEIG